MPHPDPASEGTPPSAASGHRPGRVAVIMGSQSDWPVMRHAAETLDALGIPHDARIVSAHRTPDRLCDFARGARDAGYSLIIAGAGGAAHLPGMTAAMTPLPVFGVPVPGTALGGHDALYSIVQMPGGVPVGTLAIGKPGAINAALLAAAVLALNDPALAERLDAFRAANTAAVAEEPVDAPADQAPQADQASQAGAIPAKAAPQRSGNGHAPGLSG